MKYEANLLRMELMDAYAALGMLSWVLAWVLTASIAAVVLSAWIAGRRAARLRELEERQRNVRRQVEKLPHWMR